MKQGKTLQELGRELQRQRNNRQGFLADTRSLEMESGRAGSILHLTLNGKSSEYGVNEVAHQQIANRLNIPYRYYQVGLGSLRVEPLIFRLVCKNGMICKDYAQKRYHVGKQVNLSEDSAYEIYSDETIAQDDKAFFMKVQDVVRAAVDENKFLLTVNKLREAKDIPLKNQPVK